MAAAAVAARELASVPLEHNYHYLLQHFVICGSSLRAHCKILELKVPKVPLVLLHERYSRQPNFLDLSHRMHFGFANYWIALVPVLAKQVLLNTSYGFPGNPTTFVFVVAAVTINFIHHFYFQVGE